MPLFASDVKIPDALSQSFQQIGQQGTNNINSIYGNLKNRYAADARGYRPGGPDMGPGSYAGERFATGQGLSQGNLEAGLGGTLGETGYKDTLAERDYQQQRQIAEAAAEAARPSVLEQVLQGIGGAANSGLQAAALYKQFSTPSMSPGTANTPSTLSLPGYTNPFDYGFENYGVPSYRTVGGGY